MNRLQNNQLEAKLMADCKQILGGNKYMAIDKPYDDSYYIETSRVWDFDITEEHLKKIKSVKLRKKATTEAKALRKKQQQSLKWESFSPGDNNARIIAEHDEHDVYIDWTRVNHNGSPSISCYECTYQKGPRKGEHKHVQYIGASYAEQLMANGIPAKRMNLEDLNKQAQQTTER